MCLPRHVAGRFFASLQMVLLCGGALGVPTLVGQDAPPGLVEVREGGRRGFWFGLGAGAGGESNDVSGPGYSGLFYQPTISLRAGGTVSQHLRLGGEILSWFDEQGDATASLSSALFVAQFYPLRGSGLYLKGGVGIGRNAVDFDNGFDVGDTGFAGLVGAGLENDGTTSGECG